MLKEVEDMFKEPMTTIQKQKAVHYAVIFLQQETEQIKESILNCNDEFSKNLLIGRSKELQADLEFFEKVNDYYS